MTYYPRLVSNYAFRPDWMENKMTFLAGPRQVGKTYIAQEFLKQNSSSSLYYNWDLAEIAKRYRKDPSFFESDAKLLRLNRPTMVFDEFHKRTKWKNELKGIYDRYIKDLNIVVTGSARLDLLRHTGESLAGRYFLYRVLPIGLQEYSGQCSHQLNFANLKELMEQLSGVPSNNTPLLKDLLLLGGFPDPLSKGSMEYRRKWEVDYQRLVLKEDLRDLSRIQEIDRVETLWSLLPERVGVPLSVTSLREDVSASHEAVRTWLLNLEKLYSIFFLLPYSQKISRAVKKERKVYLIDWALHEDESKRFENFVILSLFRSLCVWNDTGQGKFDLRYIRNVFGKEADFLIVKDKKPWIIGDAKLASLSIDSHLYKMSHELGDIPIIQVVQSHGIFKCPTPTSLIISAGHLFRFFP